MTSTHVFIIYILGERNCFRFSDSDIHESLCPPVLLHPLIFSHLGIMSKDVRVLCTFSRPERNTCRSENRASNNKVGKSQSVQSHVTGGARRKIRFEVVEGANKAFSTLIKSLASCVRQGTGSGNLIVLTSRLKGLEKPYTRPKML